MINDRLVWFLESNNLLTNIQCGFRQGRSTIDHLVRLENYIRDAFLKKEHVVTVFFDLEKAYETTWQYGILKDLFDFGLKGFLNDRNFRVRLGSTLSDTFPQEMGVPQGSILSVTLFSIKINSIASCMKTDTEGSLYVDDFSISYRSKHMCTMERHLQQCLNKLTKWADTNGFKFSKTKTVCMHFCQLRGLHPDPTLFLAKDPIPVVEEFKFLGLILDPKLTFIPHIRYLRAKCKKSLDILKVLSSTDWGSNRDTLLMLYKAIILSKLDYGSIIYGSARPSYLRPLDSIHHEGLRICLGAYRTSPVESLYVESNEPSLSSRRTKLSLDYTTKMQAYPNNPAYNCVFHAQHENMYAYHQRIIPSFGVRTIPHFEAAEIPSADILPSILSPTPPWLLEIPTVIYSLHNRSKSTTHPLEFQSLFAEIRHTYRDHQPIYTDGSKDQAKVSAAMYAPPFIDTSRLPDNASIFSAELHALLLALRRIETHKSSKFIIFTDSLSSLQSLSHFNIKHPLILKLLEHYTHLHHKGKSIIFCWIPSHMGIKGNEKVDSLAKAALNSTQSSLKVPYSDFKPLSRKYITQFWQLDWDNLVNNKLHHIQPSLKQNQHISAFSRRENVVLTRLRIGHSHLTHSFLLKKEPRPLCTFCNVPLSIEHILMTCSAFARKRSSFFNVMSSKILFEKVAPEHILNYLESIDLYHKI
ncbi:hypothetical protein BOW52_09705 [Solemya elarraichensis gill symbiont]|uniref:Reverse transcriptase domain-containing protein n=2 Tax=Solemya elarraichensis gill symbiont TaxID=1918949 RepID=A0A1T2KYQ8_9GAMM|nr:hypothetical protein BOW52_09705 [Solemya elarraichensis gill symbiont]